MNTNLKSTTISQTNQTGVLGHKKAPAFNVQTSLQAGVQDDNPYNDRARARRFAQGAANFLADFFS